VHFYIGKFGSNPLTTDDTRQNNIARGASNLHKDFAGDITEFVDFNISPHTNADKMTVSHTEISTCYVNCHLLSTVKRVVRV